MPGLSRSKTSVADCWEPRMRAQGRKWSERRSSCERPRTYDKFYQKTPGNFQSEQERDSAISVCSSEECEQEKKEARGRRRKPRRSQSERRVRTLTEKDVKHLERHLSLKRTIRKKIMQDLQNAFVRSPERGFGQCQINPLKDPLDPNVLDLLRDSGTEDSGHHSPTRCLG